MTKTRRKNAGFGIVGLIITLLIAALVSAIVWRILEPTSSEEQENSPAPSSQETPARSEQPTESATPAVDTEQIIIAAAKLFCESQNQDLQFSQGTIGPSQKNIVYSADRQFAKMNVRCATQDSVGSGIEYILSKNSGQWQVIIASSEERPDLMQQYNVPANFE